MNRAAHPIVEHAINPLLSLHPIEPSECFGNDDGPKMATAILGAGVARMKMGFVNHFDVGCRQTLS